MGSGNVAQGVLVSAIDRCTSCMTDNVWSFKSRSYRLWRGVVLR